MKYRFDRNKLSVWYSTRMLLCALFSQLNNRKLALYNLLIMMYSNTNIRWTYCGINYAIFSFKKNLCDDFYERLFPRWFLPEYKLINIIDPNKRDKTSYEMYMWYKLYTDYFNNSLICLQTLWDYQIIIANHVIIN